MKTKFRMATARFGVVVFAGICALLAEPAARAQGVRHDGIVFGPQGRPVAGATIAVCTQPADTTTTPCTPLAALYTDSTLTTSAPNPLTGDGLGNFHFYAAPGTYTVQIYGPGLTTYVIPDVLLPGPSTGGGPTKPHSPSDGVNSTTGENIVFVSPNGSDANDCLSWGSACLTLYHAYEMLPIKKLSMGEGGGQIFFSQGSTMGGPVANQGLWVMGGIDPNYCTIAAANGLVRASGVVTATCTAAAPYTVSESISVHNADNPDFDGTFTVASVAGDSFTFDQSGPNETSQNGGATPVGWLPAKNVRITGVASQSMTGTNFANEPATQLIAGSGSNPALPGIWLDGIGSFSLDHVSLNACVPILVGEDSGGHLNDSGAFGLQITNSTFSTNATSGCGPTETIGSNVLWLWEDHDTFGANNTAAVSSDQRANILLNGGSGAASSSLELYFSNINLNYSGGIKVHGASMPGSWGLKATNITEESDGATTAQPALWIADALCAAVVYADNLSVADAPPGSMPAYENDSTCPAAQFVLGDNILQSQPNVPSIQGPATLTGGYPYMDSVTADPIAQHEYGMWNAGESALPHAAVQVDDARREFGPSAVRYPTLLDQTFAAWTPQSAALTTGIGAPDATSNAVKISTTSTRGDIVQATSTMTLNAGDWIIGGVWAKPDAVGQSFGTPSLGGGVAEIVLTNGALTTAAESWPPTGGASMELFPSNQGDGHWEWIPFALKVTTGASGSGIEMFLYVDPSHPIDYFAPMVLHIAAGTIADSEALELMQTLKPYADSCAVGTVCSLRGENLMLPGSAVIGGGQPWFDAAAFGAKCDDATDDTAAINAAIAAVPATGGVVRFSGICKFTSTITITKTDVTFEGQGHFQFITQNDPETYLDYQGASGNGIKVAAQGFKMENLGIKYPTSAGGPLSPPAAPSLSQVTGSGCPAEAYYVEATYLNAQGQTTASAESTFTTTTGNCLQVASPASAPGATGWNVWVSANSNNETLQNSAPLAIGTAWTFGGTLVNLGYRPLFNTTAYSAIYDNNGGQFDGVKIFTADDASAGTATMANGYTSFGCCGKLHNVYIAGFGVGIAGAGSNNDFSVTDSYVQSNYLGAYMTGGAMITFDRDDFEANVAGNLKIVYGAPYSIVHDYFEQPFSPTGYVIQLGDTTLPPQGSLSVLPQNVTIDSGFFQCGLTSYPPGAIVVEAVQTLFITNNQFSQCGSQDVIVNTAGAGAAIRIRNNNADTLPAVWLTSTTGVVEDDLNTASKTPGVPFFYGLGIDSASGASSLTWRSGGATDWTTNANATSLAFLYNGHLGETTFKLAPFGGQSYAGVYDNFGMTAGFVAATESSGTVSFDAGLGNTFEVTLNANVTSSTLQNAQPGQWLTFVVCQPSSGGPYTFAWPSNVKGAMTVGATAGKCSAQSFAYDGTSAFANSPGVTNQ